MTGPINCNIFNSTEIINTQLILSAHTHTHVNIQYTYLGTSTAKNCRMLCEEGERRLRRISIGANDIWIRQGTPDRRILLSFICVFMLGFCFVELFFKHTIFYNTPDKRMQRHGNAMHATRSIIFTA